MPQPKTVAQELIEDTVEKPAEVITVGSEQGDKPTLEGKSGETEQQEFEKELFSTETSAETPSDEKQKEEPKELEKAKADAAFWQEQYQTFDGLLKKADPIQRDNLNKQLRAQRKGKTEEPTEDSFKTATDSVREEKVDIYENPQGFLDAIDKRFAKFEDNLVDRFQQNQDIAYQQASWEQEAKAAEQAVNQLKSNYKAELKLDDNTWKGVEDGAWQDVMSVLGLTENNKNDFIGTLGGPSKTARVFQLSLKNRLLEHSYLTKIAEGQADVSGKIKAAAEVAQPASQATPAPKDVSKTEKIIKAIEGAKGDQTAKNEIFGG